MSEQINNTKMSLWLTESGITLTWNVFVLWWILMITKGCECDKFFLTSSDCTSLTCSLTINVHNLGLCNIDSSLFVVYLFKNSWVMIESSRKHFWWSYHMSPGTLCPQHFFFCH